MKKTALVLSGGGSRGAYQIGVWEALSELDVTIDMVFGTSVGSINGAMVVQGDLELSRKLWQQMETDMIFDIETSGLPSEDAWAYAKEIVLRGGAGTSGLGRLLREYIDEDRVRNAAADYGLVTVEFPSLEGHFLYKSDIPYGRLADYILASASCFPAAQKYVIGDREFIDGGYRDNLPVEMALDRGATSIIAVDLHAAGIVRHSAVRKAKEVPDGFHMIESPLDLGNFLIFDKLNTGRIMRLGYLDTMREFGVYEGERYTFRKNTFSSHDLMGADSAAYCFRLDPCTVYDDAGITDALKKRTSQRIPKPSELSPREILAAAADIAEGIFDGDAHGRLVIHIAEDLEEKQENSIYLQPAIFDVLRREIQAANFLITCDLI